MKYFAMVAAVCALLMVPCVTPQVNGSHNPLRLAPVKQKLNALSFALERLDNKLDDYLLARTVEAYEEPSQVIAELDRIVDTVFQSDATQWDDFERYMTLLTHLADNDDVPEATVKKYAFAGADEGLQFYEKQFGRLNSRYSIVDRLATISMTDDVSYEDVLKLYGDLVKTYKESKPDDVQASQKLRHYSAELTKLIDMAFSDIVAGFDDDYVFKGYFSSTDPYTVSQRSFSQADFDEFQQAYVEWVRLADPGQLTGKTSSELTDQEKRLQARFGQWKQWLSQLRKAIGQQPQQSNKESNVERVLKEITRLSHDINEYMIQYNQQNQLSAQEMQRALSVIDQYMKKVRLFIAKPESSPKYLAILLFETRLKYPERVSRPLPAEPTPAGTPSSLDIAAQINQLLAQYNQDKSAIDTQQAIRMIEQYRAQLEAEGKNLPFNVSRFYQELESARR